MIVSFQYENGAQNIKTLESVVNLVKDNLTVQKEM